MTSFIFLRFPQFSELLCCSPVRRFLGRSKVRKFTDLVALPLPPFAQAELSLASTHTSFSCLLDRSRVRKFVKRGKGHKLIGFVVLALLSLLRQSCPKQPPIYFSAGF